MTHRIEPFLLIWLTEWNPSFKNLTQRIEPFFKILLKELNPFQHMTRRIEHFFQKNFFNMTQRMKFFNMFWRVEPFLIWPKELTFLEKWVKYLNPFWNMTQRIEFFSYDSNNWALLKKKKWLTDFFKFF